MALVGIIAEFNPFHLGHTLPIQAARAAMDGAGAVVCVMSGNCVQRGDLAIFQKIARAEAAIHAGADLVIELPAPYVLGSAERFATGGIALLAAMNEPDTRLAFGCETADATALTAVAHALDTPDTQAKIKTCMGEGQPYGKACQMALDTPLLQTPNNLLAIEYLRATHRLGADIKPIAVARQGVAHDGDSPSEGYASATYLRGLFRTASLGDDAHIAPRPSPYLYMPPVAAEIIQRELAAGRGPASLEQLAPTVLTLLRLREAPDMGYLDDSEGLSARITNSAAEVGSLAELLEAAKTKRYHLSRIRRLILAMCLGLTSRHRPPVPPYIRPLAANQTGRALLRRLTKTAALPIISRPAEVKKLGPTAERIMAKEAAVSDLQALCFRSGLQNGGSEWKQIPQLEP